MLQFVCDTCTWLAAACTMPRLAEGASTTPPPLSCHDHIPTQFRPKQTISSARAARSLVQPLKVGAPCGTSCRRHRTEPTQLGPGGAFLGSLGGTARHRFFGRPSLEGLRTDKKTPSFRSARALCPLLRVFEGQAQGRAACGFARTSAPSRDRRFLQSVSLTYRGA